MIVPMKKVTILVQEKDSQDTIQKLGSLGVLHVQHEKQPIGKNIEEIRANITLIDNAINSFPQEATKEELSLPNGKHGDALHVSKHIIDLAKRKEQLQEYAQKLISQIEIYKPWGDFDPALIQGLQDKDVFVKLYQIPLKQIKELPEDIIVKRISNSKEMANCVIIARKTINLAFPEVQAPRQSLGSMQARLKEDLAVIKKTQDELAHYGAYKKCLLDAKNQFEKKLEFEMAIQGMGQSESKVLSYITGFLPVDSVRLLQNAQKAHRWAMVISDPQEEDMVPTLLKHPKWISIIQPVFKLLEIIPGYKELDISPLFLLFLSLFFGMIIGDAGYGALYFLITFLIQRKFRKKLSDKKAYFLFYLFSSCAIFWGLMTGTVFGQEWISKAGFKGFIPILNDLKFLQAFCFFLGAFHLTLGHLWQAVKKFPSIIFISDIGWVFVLWAAFFVARMLILNDPFPFFGKWFIIIGVSLVIFFSNPQKNILKTIGSGIGTVLLSLMNNFTDVVSYVRLFAVGLAGIAIADTVNSLATSFGNGNLLIQAFIVSIGHTINIILGPMSVLVHGIRLNVLEFSSHAGLFWSGVVYKPLKE